MGMSSTSISSYTSRMKRFLILPVLLLTLLVGTPAFSADFQKGFIAAESGDYATALREWTPLAKQGHATAQFNLGLMYRNGWGVPQDYKAAVKWYSLSADQGITNAQNNLGGMYDNGRGVPQDYKTAVKWYSLSAGQGHANAQFNLGWMYYNGQGVLQDSVYAHMWWNIAASSGHKNAVTNKDIVAGKMIPSQLKKAQDLARECVRKNHKGC
jgi:TPR repeat protein